MVAIADDEGTCAHDHGRHHELAVVGSRIDRILNPRRAINRGPDAGDWVLAGLHAEPSQIEVVRVLHHTQPVAAVGTGKTGAKVRTIAGVKVVVEVAAAPIAAKRIGAPMIALDINRNVGTGVGEQGRNGWEHCQVQVAQCAAVAGDGSAIACRQGKNHLRRLRFQGEAEGTREQDQPRVQPKLRLAKRGHV